MFRRTLVLMCLAAALCIAGCQQDQPAPAPKSPRKDDTRSTAAPPSRPEPARPAGTGSKPSAPAVALKPAVELKVPGDLTVPLNDMKLPRQAWDEFARMARVGQFTEYEVPDGKVRQEIFDLADHAALQLTESVVRVEGMEFKSRMAAKLLYTEPETRLDSRPDFKPDPTASNRARVETKSANRKFSIGGQEVVADKVMESYLDGKLTQKTWMSGQVPLGGVVLVEDADGKVPMKLVNFSRGQ